MNLKTFILFLLLVLFGTIANSQKVNIDSIKKLIRIESNDSMMMCHYYELSKEICHTQPDSGIYYAWKAYDIAKDKMIEHGKASSLSQIGFSFYKKEHADSSIYYFEKSAKLYDELGAKERGAILWKNVATQKIWRGEYKEATAILDKLSNYFKSKKDTLLLAQILIDYGLMYDLKGDLKNGYKYYHDAYEKYATIENIEGMGTAKNNISVMNYYLEEYRTAIKYGLEANEIWKDDRFLGQRSKAVKNIAVSYDLLGLKDSAEYFHLIAIDYDSQLNNEFGLAKTYNNLGAMYADIGRTDEALNYLLKSKTLKEKHQLRSGIANTYNYLGSIYTKLNNYNLAEEFLEKAKDASEKLQSKTDLSDNAVYFSELYEAQGNFQQALNHYKTYKILHDTIVNTATKSSIAEIEIKYESEKKQKENKELLLQQKHKEITISNQQNMISIGILGLGLLSLLSYLLYRQSSKRKEANVAITKQRDHIRLLNREINHRVKNNLSFMTSLLEMQGRRISNIEAKTVLKESESRLKTLSLVHSNLFKNEEDVEINLKLYLEEIVNHLQSIFNLPNKELIINGYFEDYNINAEDAMRIGLIVNELVTNSVKHAFIHVDSPEINMETKMEKQQLLLRYKDNGPGIKEEFIDNPIRTQSGMGHKLIELLVKQIKGKMVTKKNVISIIVNQFDEYI